MTDDTGVGRGSATAGPLWTYQCLKSDITASVCRAITKKWFRNMALCQTANDAINALKPSSAKTNGLDMEQGHQQRGRFRSLAAVLQNGPIECRDLLMTRYRAACKGKDVFEWQGLGFCSGLRFLLQTEPPHFQQNTRPHRSCACTAAGQTECQQVRRVIFTACDSNFIIIRFDTNHRPGF